MKKLIIPILSASLFTLLFLGGCKKEEDEPVVKQPQTDQSGATEADDVLDDVNDFISNKVGTGSANMRTAATYNLPCGVVSVDSTALGTTPQTYTYNFHYGSQTACGYKYKSGVVSFALLHQTKFSTAGAVYRITFTDYKVEVKATKSNITLNGDLYVTNVNGHYIWETGVNNQTVTHKLRGTLTITYDNGAQRIRSYFQQRVWASSSNWTGLSLTVSGDTTIGSYTAVCDTGTTYDGNFNFKTNLSTPLKWSNCGSTWAGPYVLKQGNALMDITIPLISPTTIQVEAGYDWNIYNLASQPSSPVNSCSSNAYKIVTTIGTTTSTKYQLY